MLNLDPKARYISAATVYFLLLSSIVTAVALWQFHTPTEEGDSTISLAQIPEPLQKVALSHMMILGVIIEEAGTRFDIGLISSMNNILTCLCKNLDHEDSWRLFTTALQTMARYRWCGRGRGVFAISEDEANLEWRYVDILPQSSASAFDILQRRAGIISLGDPEARICQPGFFDLSIRFL